MSDEELRPIIIKKIKKGGHAHHGGAWKVAYADFVTAMMAFFLLLWLISSVDEAKLEGLAEYFTPTVGIKDSMGIGFEGGTTANIDGTKRSDTSPPGLIVGVDHQGPVPQQPEQDTMTEAEADGKLFDQAEEAIKRAFETDPNLRDLADNIIVEQSPEGMKIEIMDSDKYPMFDAGSAILTEFGRRILGKMNEVIKSMPNFISLEGHTDVTPMRGSRARDYSNWELSADRANAARRYLIRVGMDAERPKKVVGKASTELLLPDQPAAARNRRITIILLRGDYMDLAPGDLPATRELLSVPSPGRRPSDQLKEQRKAEEEKRQEELQNRRRPVVDPLLAPGQAPVGNNPADALNQPRTLQDRIDDANAPLIGIESSAPQPIRETTEEELREFMDE